MVYRQKTKSGMVIDMCEKCNKSEKCKMCGTYNKVSCNCECPKIQQEYNVNLNLTYCLLCRCKIIGE